MTQKTAELLIESAYNAGINAEIYENYSGRGMYGTTTTGITIENELEFALAVAETARNATDEEYDTLCNELKRLRTDSLGFNIIIY
jgi:hypothetical protein